MRTVLRGLATLIDERLAISRGDLAPIPPAQVLPPAPVSAPAPAPRGAFFDRWDDFSASKRQEQSWTAETQSNARASSLLFKGLLGALTYPEITREKVAKVRSDLFKIPKFHDKDARFRG
jgi:hypothetical protein